MEPSSTKQVELPAALVKDSLGFSIDMGNSRCKYVYIDQYADNSQEDMVKVNLGWFPLQNVKEATDFLKSKGFHYSAEDPPILHTTGGLAHQETKEYIQNTLNVRMKNLFEVDGLIRGFLVLAHTMPMSAVVMPPCEDAVDAVNKNKAALELMARKWNTIKAKDVEIDRTTEEASTLSAMDSMLPFSQAVPDLFPCVVGVYGTGAGCMKILGDGTGQGVDLDFGTAGRCLLGLSSVICGTSDYDELIDMAKRGDDSNVHQRMVDISDVSRTDDYGIFPLDTIAFAFGKLLDSKNRENVSKEDLASALVTFLARTLARQVYWYARAMSCKRVFLSGGIFQHLLFRHHMTVEFLSANHFRAAGTENAEMYFINNPEYIMVLGTLFAGAEFRRNLSLEK